MVSNPVMRVQPQLLRSTEPAILQVGPLNDGWLDWTVHLDEARVACTKGAPTYQPITNGEPGARAELTGWCTLTHRSNVQYVVEWHANLADANAAGLVGVRVGPMRGDGVF